MRKVASTTCRSRVVNSSHATRADLFPCGHLPPSHAGVFNDGQTPAVRTATLVWASNAPRRVNSMNTNTILIIIVVVILLGGGGVYLGR